MRLRLLIWLPCALLGACASDADDVECGDGTVDVDGICVAEPESPDRGLVCGEGTMERNGECVANDGPVPRYELRSSVAEIGADGISLIPILAIGEDADGTPVTDPIVLTVDPPGSGELVPAETTLAPSGALSYFRPCDAAERPACAGPIEVRMSLADDPEEPVAALELELVEQTGVYTAAPCLAGGNTMFFDGDGFIYTGLLTVTQAAWSLPEQLDSFLELNLVPSGQENGTRWRLTFSTEQLGQPIAVGIYEMAERAIPGSPGRAGLEIGGDGRGCNQIQGRFQVHELVRTQGRTEAATVSFEQTCEPDEPGPNRLYGCFHYEE